MSERQGGEKAPTETGVGMIFNGDERAKKVGKVYIVHGWTYTITPWEPVVKKMEEEGVEVVLVKIPGLTKPSKAVWDVDGYVKYLEKSIPNGAIALGHSNGGRLLMNLCIKNPKKLKHLILLDAAGVYEPSKKRDVTKKIANFGKKLKNIPWLRKVYHKIIGANDYDKAPENMKKTLANMLESDKTLDISQVTTPTTIIWGGRDTITPLHQGKILKERIPKSRMIVREKWPHSAYLTYPMELAKLLVKVVGDVQK